MNIPYVIGRNFSDAQGLAPYRYRDPLALDLDGDGLETAGLGAGIMFDHDGDGLLVFDRNNDGIINNGRELFGDGTLRYDGNGTCRDAFEALAQEDSNNDGVVNHLDDNWGRLRVWRDINQDGISQAGELFTLEQLGITALNLDKTAVNRRVEGGILVSQGSYSKEDGSTGLTGQFDFSDNPFYSHFTDQIEIPEQYRHLPNLGGSGLARDLMQAAMLNPYLLNTLNFYDQAGSRAEQMELLGLLVFNWANTSGLATSMAERAGSRYKVIQKNVPGDLGAWNAKLHILEAFNGRYFFTLPHELEYSQLNFKI